MYLKDVIKIIENKYPKNLAYSWDNIGLLIGDKENNIEKILVTLEATEAVVDEAISKNIDLIITHHPFIFKGLKNIDKNDPKGRCIYKLIQNNISLYSAHTNFDIAFGGLNDKLANMLNLNDIKVLETTYSEKLYKIIVYVPTSHENEVRNAMALSGAGHIGNYSHCSFNTNGIGTFMPLENTNPYIGSTGNLEKVKEIKIETVCKKQDLHRIINEMIKTHPYEEVAYDIYELHNDGEKYGIGRIGNLNENISLKDFANIIKNKLNLKDLRIVGDINKQIKNIAIVTGSGAEFISKAKNMGAHVIITGDVKYHDAQDAIERGICVVDAGHFGTENIFPDTITEYLENALMNIEIIKSTTYINPFLTI